MLGKEHKAPQYIRGLNLKNKLKNPIEAIFKFKSGDEQKYTINHDKTEFVKKTIEKGTKELPSKAVDPIENVKVSVNNSTRELNFDPQGVEILFYEVTDNGSEEIFFKKVDTKP